MNHRTCLITGATSGIGKAAAFKLAKLGYRLILVGRNDIKLKKTTDCIAKKTGNEDITHYRCDLSLLCDVQVAAERIIRDFYRVDALINNAGARILRYQLTSEGKEKTLATNHLGHFMLTLSLICLLERSGEARVINVSSAAHYSGKDVIKNILSAKDYEGNRQYSESKLANILFTYALADKLTDRKISVNAVDPGGVATNFARNNGCVHWLRHLLHYLRKGKLRTPSHGAETIVYLASSEEVAGMTGKLFMDKKVKRSSDISYNKRIQEKLWSLSVALTGIDFQK